MLEDGLIHYDKNDNHDKNDKNDKNDNYDKNDKRPLQIGINKKVIGMFKDELGGKIMK